MGDGVVFSKRKIGVTGSLPRSKAADSFLEAIGGTLAESDSVVVTRGGKPTESGRESAENPKFPVDELVVGGALAVLAKRNRQPEPWIETVLSEAGTGHGDRQVFRVGTVTQTRGGTYEAERFAFVNRVDGLIGVAGAFGTDQALVLALATERPILPVPSFGESSSRVWQEHRSECLRRFALDDDQATTWETRPTGNESAAALAADMVKRLLHSMERQCFVVMPFHVQHEAIYDFVIEPAIRSLGDRPIRLDRAAMPGDVGRQIHQGLDAADYVVVVLEGWRRNVLYELGLAHGFGKPTILLLRTGDRDGTDAEDGIPFDLTLHQRIEYDEIDRRLPERLRGAIRALRDAPRSRG